MKLHLFLISIIFIICIVNCTNSNKDLIKYSSTSIEKSPIPIISILHKDTIFIGDDEHHIKKKHRDSLHFYYDEFINGKTILDCFYKTNDSISIDEHFHLVNGKLHSYYFNISSYQKVNINSLLKKYNLYSVFYENPKYPDTLLRYFSISQTDKKNRVSIKIAIESSYSY